MKWSPIWMPLTALNASHYSAQCGTLDIKSLSLSDLANIFIIGPASYIKNLTKRGELKWTSFQHFVKIIAIDLFRGTFKYTCPKIL